MIKLFISYRSLDAAKVDAIVTRLKSLRDGDQPLYSVWQDKKDILPGQDWWESILDAIEGCDVFLFNISQESLRSDVCRAELHYAYRRNRPIVPVVLEGEFAFNPATDKADIAYWQDIPRELNDLRAQFLFYIPGEFYTRFNATIEALRAQNRQDIPSPRPVAPDGAGASNEILYDKACVHAYNLEFDEARALFQQLTYRKDSGFAKESFDWIRILNQYEQLVKTDAARAARFRLPTLWDDYIKLFPKDFIDDIFDPKGFAQGFQPIQVARPQPPDPGQSHIEVPASEQQRRASKVIAGAIVGAALILAAMIVLPQIASPIEQTQGSSDPTQEVAQLTTLSTIMPSEEKLGTPPNNAPPAVTSVVSPTDISAIASQTLASASPIPPTATSTSTPTPSPTDIPRASDTLTNTNTPVPTATPGLAMIDEFDASILLNYDGRALVLYNRSPSKLNANDVKDLQFWLFEPNEDGVIEQTAIYQARDWNILASLSTNNCLLVYITRFGTFDNNESPADICRSVPTFRSSRSVFWLSPGWNTGAYFQVRLGPVNIIATCQVSEPETRRVKRCLIPLQ